MSNIDTILESRSTIITFHSLHSLLKAVGMDYATLGSHPITLFAPPDAAFNSLHRRSFFDLLADPAKLSRLLGFHIVPLKLTKADMVNLASSIDQGNNGSEIPGKDRPLKILLETLADDPVTITLTHDFMVENARIREADIAVDNGVIHIIDKIIWPPGLSEESFGDRNPPDSPDYYESSDTLVYPV